MKKVVIGSVFMSLGVLVSLSILITASLALPKIHSWRGSKLLYAIFDSEFGQGLGVGIPFVLGLVLLIIGVSILTIEMFKEK